LLPGILPQNHPEDWKIDGIEMKAMLTPNAVESMNLEKGKKVYASFKAAATKIVRRV